uniref:Microtubule-associated protein 70-1-like n=1 Tax=Tanacetum cinerariifolium TaxID=118510 RepID=A0A6L2PAW9_TANCI|nr:microtubule-associated protein 70-1-like [Tanacetum cinerariifolium]
MSQRRQLVEPKKGATNVSNTSKSSSMVKSTGNSSKKGNITTSNSYSVLKNDEEEDEEHVENVYDESANLYPNSKPGESSTFTVAADHKHRATVRPSLDNDDLIHLVHGLDPIKVELNRLENEVRDPVKPTR